MADPKQNSNTDQKVASWIQSLMQKAEEREIRVIEDAQSKPSTNKYDLD